MNIATIFNHSSQINRSFRAIDHQFNRSKDPDDAAPSPLPPSFFDVSSSLEVVRMSSEASALSFCLQICLPFCRFVFLYFCLTVFLSLCLSVLVHIKFISVHISYLEFAWKPSEYFLLSFRVFVFRCNCLSVIVSFHLSSSLVQIRSSQFIGGRTSSSRVPQYLSWRCRAKKCRMGLIIIGHRSSKSTFSGNKKDTIKSVTL